MASSFSPIAMFVPSTSPYHSLVAQARLLARELEFSFGELDFSWMLSGTLEKGVHSLRSLSGDSSVIFHYGSFDWAVFPLARRHNTVFVYHNITPARFFWKWQPLVGLRSLLGQMQLRILPKDIQWVGVSEFNAACLRSLGFRNVLVCPAVVDREPLAQPVGRDENALLFVGRISPNKNCIELLENIVKAADGLKHRVKLTIVGDSKPGCRYGVAFSNFCQSLYAHPRLELKWITSGISSENLAALYASASLYVSTSLHEGFGLPVCEAVAAGCPALYLECGGTETVLSGYGMVPLAERDHFWRFVVDCLSQVQARQQLLTAQNAQVQKCMRPEVTDIVQSVYSRLLR